MFFLFSPFSLCHVPYTLDVQVSKCSDRLLAYFVVVFLYLPITAALFACLSGHGSLSGPEIYLLLFLFYALYIYIYHRHKNNIKYRERALGPGRNSLIKCDRFFCRYSPPNAIFLLRVSLRKPCTSLSFFFFSSSSYSYATASKTSRNASCHRNSENYIRFIYSN